MATAASRCEFDRIIDEVRNRFDQQFEIAADRKRRRCVQRKRDWFGFGQRLVEFEHQVHTRKTAAPPPGFDLGDSKKGGDGGERLAQVAESAFRRGAQLLAGIGRKVAFELGPHHRERGAQIVRDIVADALDLLKKPDDLVEHKVNHSSGRPILPCVGNRSCRSPCMMRRVVS
jgi:hypothetical protein